MQLLDCLQLFYLIGVLSSKLKRDELNFSVKEKKEFNFNLTKIISVFFYCINSRLCIKEKNESNVSNLNMIFIMRFKRKNYLVIGRANDSDLILNNIHLFLIKTLLKIQII